MGDLLTKVLPLSLGAAVSPTVLGVILVILSGRRAVARGGAYLAGVLLVLAGLTVVGLYGVRDTDPSPATVSIERVVDGIAGVLLLLLALGTVLRAALRDPATPADQPPPDSDRQHGLGGAFVLGIAMMVSNFSTILLYLPATSPEPTRPRRWRSPSSSRRYREPPRSCSGWRRREWPFRRSHDCTRSWPVTNSRSPSPSR